MLFWFSENIDEQSRLTGCSNQSMLRTKLKFFKAVRKEKRTKHGEKIVLLQSKQTIFYKSPRLF